MSDVVAASLVPLCADATRRERIAQYAAILLERSATINLTGARDPAALAEHLRDALSISKFIDGPLVDVGSGGGLPGIPLAIARDVPVTLIEATVKKARFLETVVAALDLEATVVVGRAEVAAHDPALRERFARATARAVGALPTVMELTLPFLALAGLAVLQRGVVEEPERRAATAAALMLGGEIIAEEAVAPGRCVVLIEKRRPTPLRFPRRTGIPTKRPLCAEPRAVFG